MNFSRQIRTLALGAALTFSVVGMPAIHAFAATPTGGAPLHGRPTPVTVSPDLSVQGGSTGQPGSATDAQCQNLANGVNTMLGTAQHELNQNGMTSYWNELVDGAKQLQDQALDEGCFLVNPA
jgi:hypothetical protein